MLHNFNQDGGWTQWSDWDTCTLTCGGGNQTHTRNCTEPPPQFGGIDCDGLTSDTQSCNENPCPIGKHIKDLKLYGKNICL